MRVSKSAGRTIELREQTLHYKLWSEAGPPLIFLHGITSACSSWDAIARRFTEHYRVMAFDLRGHGQSSKPESGYSWANHYAQDFIELVEEHIESPAIIIGHSLGAMVTVPVAVQARTAVRAIVLEDPPAFAPTENPQHNPEFFEPLLELKRLPLAERIERLKGQGFGVGPATHQANNLETMSEQVLVEALAGQAPYHPKDWFPRVTCSSLVILGHPDRGGVVELSDRARLRSFLPQGKIVAWDDVGHLIHAEKPSRFTREVTAFLETLD